MHNDLTATKPNAIERPRHVLFFAAIPPPEIKAQMARAWQSFGTGEDFRQDTLHLSIYGVASMDDRDPIVVQRAQTAAAVVRTAPFTLCFDRIMTFNGGPDDFPLVIATDNTSKNTNEIAADLHVACRAMALTASRSPQVNPHVTLAYGPGFPGERLLTKPILWTITEIMLIDSLYGKGRHISLGQWSLPKDRQQPSFDF